MVVNEKKYKFIISKDRSYKGKYNVLKKEPTPLDKIKELFKFEKNQDGKVDSVKVKKKTSLLKTLGIISILFILVFGGLIYFILSNLTYDMYVPPYSEKDMGIDINPISYGMANINGHNIFTPYIMFDVQAHKLDEVEYFIEAADGPLYDTVYLLNSKREDGTRYDEFKNELREKMKLYGVPVNEIDLESLKNIPEGTSSVLVVPSGYFPVQFVNNETSVRKLNWEIT